MPYIYLSLNADKIELNENLTAFELKHFKAANWLSKQLNIDSKLAQKFIDQGRLISVKSKQNFKRFDVENHKIVLKTNQLNFSETYQLSDETNSCVIKKSDYVSDYVFLIVYAAKPLQIEVIYENEEFVVFNKPSGLLTHPNGRKSDVSLCDELWFKYGEDACVVHRLDAQTSGLILCAKHTNSAVKLKQMMAEGLMYKKYQLLAKGVFKYPFCIGAKIGLDKTALTLKNKMHIADLNKNVVGKIARTEFYPICSGTYKGLEATYIECNLLTGRQHQIRAHLTYINSYILGDTLYGVSPTEAILFLENKDIPKLVEGVDRLMLHSAMIVFEYNKRKYEFIKDAEFSLD